MNPLSETRVLDLYPKWDDKHPDLFIWESLQVGGGKGTRDLQLWVVRLKNAAYLRPFMRGSIRIPMRVTIVILYSICPSLLKMSSVVFACDVQHLKNRKIRVDIAGQQQQGKAHHLHEELYLVMYLGLLAFSTTISLSMFFSLFRIVLSHPVMNAFFPAAVPASYIIPILSSKLALRGKLFSLEQASKVLSRSVYC